jgi:hypothetical protein
MGFVTVKYPNDHQLNVTTDDLGCRGSCGVPSIWHRSTTRQAPRRNRSLRHPALPPGWRVVALREVDGCHTAAVAWFLLPGLMRERVAMSTQTGPTVTA